MALIFGTQFFPIRVIRVIRGSAAFGMFKVEICLGLGIWDFARQVR
jgi:hypothetical protein